MKKPLRFLAMQLLLFLFPFQLLYAGYYVKNNGVVYSLIYASWNPTESTAIVVGTDGYAQGGLKISSHVTFPKECFNGAVSEDLSLPVTHIWDMDPYDSDYRILPLVTDETGQTFKQPYPYEINMKNAIKLNYINEFAFYTPTKLILDKGGLHRLSKISIGEHVQEIGQYAFYCCKWLTDSSLIIPPHVRRIDSGAFAGCNIKSLVIPSSVTYLGSDNLRSTGVFEDCADLETIELNANVISIQGNAFRRCVKLRSVVLPKRVNIVYMDAFNSCKSLEYVKFNEMIETIEPGVFSGCVSLKTVILTNGLKYLGAFPEGCQPPVNRIINGLFNGCVSLQSIEIPNTVEAIGQDAFKNCTGLASVTLSEKLKKIEDFTFYGCMNLSSVGYLAEEAATPAMNSFVENNSPEIVLGEGIETIGKSAFQNCLSIKTLRLPESLNEISSSAFKGCLGINDIYVVATTPATMNPDCFDAKVYTEAILHVPVGSRESYKSAEGWRNFENIEETGVSSVEKSTIINTDVVPVSYFNMQGTRAYKPWQGLNIVVYSDGATRKIIYE